MGFLFGGSKQDTTTKAKLPAYVEDASKAAITRANDLATQEYTPYTGQRVAGIAENQRRANQKARTTFNEPLDMIRSGYDKASTIASNTWDKGLAQKYMNPFVEKALDPAIRRINEEAQQNAIGTRAGQIIGGGVGAFGDARTGVLEGELEEARLRGVGDTLATGYANAYDRALSEWNTTQDRKLRAADLMGVQGGRSSAVASQGISNLMATGQQRQNQEQASLDVAHQDYLDERDWGERGLNYYISTLSGVPYESKQVSSGNTGQSAAQQIGGLGLAAAGLWKAFS